MKKQIQKRLDDVDALLFTVHMHTLRNGYSLDSTRVKEMLQETRRALTLQQKQLSKLQ